MWHYGIHWQDRRQEVALGVTMLRMLTALRAAWAWQRRGSTVRAPC